MSTTVVLDDAAAVGRPSVVALPVLRDRDRLRRGVDAGRAAIAQGWHSIDIERARPLVDAAVAILESKMGMPKPPRVGETNLDFRHQIGMLQEVVPLVLAGDSEGARARANAYAAEIDRVWNRPRLR